MASEVDICNLALSHLGDNATVASIDPPEGSAQAEHCSRFYPIARDTLLEMHNWNFSTRRAVLAQRGQQGEARASQLAAPLRAAAVEVLAPHRQGPMGPLGRIVIHRHLRLLHEHTQPRPVPPHTLQNLLLFRPQLAAGQFPVHPLLDLRDLLVNDRLR